MKRTMIYTLVGLLGTALLFSCRKSDDTIATPKEAAITFISPSPNQEFERGETVNISAKITAPEKIHGYDVYILDNNSDTLYAADEHVHGTDVMVSKTWVNSKTNATDLKIIVVATLNHEGGKTLQSVTIKSR